MSLMGVDVGTTGCKAAVYATDGRLLSSAYREYPVLHPEPGRVELDSVRVFGLIQEVIREAAVAAATDPVTALSFSSMGETLVPVSRDRRILGNAIVASLDLRGGEYADAVVARVGRDAFYAINRNIPAATYSLPKLMWLRDNQPQMYAEADLFLPWGDCAAFLLGGEPCTSFAQANRTLLFDVRRETWSSCLLEASGIDGSKLPHPVASGTRAGRVDAASASALGLPDGVALVVGAHDQCCGALGAGIIQAGKAVCGMGTFACITPVYGALPDPGAMLRTGLNSEHHAVPGLYVSFIYNQAGSLVRWFRDAFASADRQLLGPDADIYAALDAEIPRTPTNLLVLPYFEPSGAPDFIADASGVIAGLRTHTTRGEILRAIMEGVAFYFVRSLDALAGLNLATQEFVATGGGARSDVWLQIMADVLGVPFVRPELTECGALGAAMLAGLATGVYDTPEAAVAVFVKPARRFEPNVLNHAHYRRQFDRYERLFTATYPILQDRAES
jgi:xylulokinase